MATCCGLPLPPEANAMASGLARDFASSPARSDTPSEGCATSAQLMRTSCVMATKSRRGS